MTNSHMVKPTTAAPGAIKPEPNQDPLPPMPAPEGAPAPVTDREPLDSPQPKPQLAPGKAHGLTTGDGKG
jgi:hypothetical protein